MNINNPIGWNRSHLRRFNKLLENELEHYEKLFKRWANYPHIKQYHFVELDVLFRLKISERNVISYQNTILELESILGPSFPDKIWEWVCSGIGVIDKNRWWHQ